MCCASPCPACSHVFLSFRDRRRGCNPRARHGRTHMYITPHLASFFNFDTQTMAYGCAVVWTGVARVQQRHRNRPPGSLPSSELGNDTGNPPGGSFHHLGHQGAPIRQEWLKVAVVFIVTPPRRRQAAKKTRLCRSRESWLPITHPCTHPTHSREVQEGDQ